MLKGKNQLASLLSAVRKQLVEPVDSKEWFEKVKDIISYPKDGSTQQVWEKIRKLAVSYSEKNDKTFLWQIVGQLYLLVEWYVSRPVTIVGGIGDKRAEALERLGIKTIYDLITHYPRSYTDRRYVQDINSLRENEQSNIYGEVVACGISRGRKPRFEVRLSDDSGIININFWNQIYLKDKIHRGDELFCSGRVDFYRGTPQLNNPDFEIIKSKGDLESSKILKPIYALTEGVTQKMMRSWVAGGLEMLEDILIDCLPRQTRRELELPSLNWSMRQVHRPDSLQNIDLARRRLIFGEFFFYQLLFVMQSYQVEKIDKDRCYGKTGLREQFIQSLPFNLTGDQRRALETIESDLSGRAPMHRLLQWDVGTGKTAVAAASLLRVVDNGWQTAFMAPTEVLAEQHYATLAQFMRELPCRLELLIGSMPGSEKDDVRAKIKSGEIDLVIGTHALIQESVDYPNLAYVVIDEQHRFGVQQRRELREKGPEIDMLIMSATPIPRSLALTAYGDLEITTLEEFPGGEKQIETELVEQTDHNRSRVYKQIRSALREGERAFFVFPAIEENEDSGLTAAEDAYEKTLRSDFFEGIEVGLVHGRMSREEKQEVMDCFRNGEVQLLYSTTVIEVGIDVPEASYLVVHESERFGLAQLHQLRGRVGRGGQDAHCYLLVSPDVSPDSKERLQILEKTNDGFEVSRHDLRFRGIGDPAGTRQSGFTWFKIGNIWEDRELMLEARFKARKMVKKHAGLEAPELILTRQKYNHQYRENQKYIKIG
ncbi:MAG: ATP-dependent DNA helicase RecG [bacterium]